MHKDFDNWNQEKQRLNAADGALFYHEREIWWCALGVNVGFEQDGTGKTSRPPHPRGKPTGHWAGGHRGVFLGRERPAGRAAARRHAAKRGAPWRGGDSSPPFEKSQGGAFSPSASKRFDRPMLILRGFNKNTFFGVALTGRKKTGTYYVPIGVIEDREATVNLSQVRLMDTKRLIRKMGTLDEKTFVELQKRLSKLLFPI